MLDFGYASLDALIIDEVVGAINELQPELDLKLKGFQIEGQPKALFTVLRRQYCDETLNKIAQGYQDRLARLKADRGTIEKRIEEQIEERIARLNKR